VVGGVSALPHFPFSGIGDPFGHVFGVLVSHLPFSGIGDPFGHFGVLVSHLPFGGIGDPFGHFGVLVSHLPLGGFGDPFGHVSGGGVTVSPRHPVCAGFVRPIPWLRSHS
jgi:hypothetical protein